MKMRREACSHRSRCTDYTDHGEERVRYSDTDARIERCSSLVYKIKVLAATVIAVLYDRRTIDKNLDMALRASVT